MGAKSAEFTLQSRHLIVQLSSNYLNSKQAIYLITLYKTCIYGEKRNVINVEKYRYIRLL